VCICVDDRKFACDWPDCRKSFLHADNLMSHRRQHTKPKPFRCDQCTLGYWQKSSLRSHQHKAHGTPAPVTTAADTMAIDGVTKTTGAVAMATSTVTTTSSTVTVTKASATARAGCSNGQMLVDGIIKSVRASLEASAASKASNVPSQPAGQDSEMTEVCGIHRDVKTNSEVITDQDSDRQANSTGAKLLSPPLNVYEFCEEDTVNIQPLKPLRTSIEPMQMTLELNKDSASDDGDHDLMVFDDDDEVTPTMDRLAETTITYSRKKKNHPVMKNRNLEATTNSVKKTTNWSGRLKRLVIARKQQRMLCTREPLLWEDCEEQSKKIRRKKGRVGDENGKLSRQQTVSRRTPSNRKSLINDHSAHDDNTWKTLLADDETDFQVIDTLSIGKKGRTRRCKPSKAESVVSVRNKEVKRTAVGNTELAAGLASNVTLSSVNSADEMRMKKVKGRMARVTRLSSRWNVEKNRHEDEEMDEDRDTAAGSDSVEELTRLNDVGHLTGDSVGPSTGDEGYSDTVGQLTGDVSQFAGDVGPEAVDECESDNTEILSFVDNNAAMTADGGDSGDAKLSPRSTPASYKSDERLLTQATSCQDNASRGNPPHTM